MLSACATLDGTRQNILVRSEPAGADVYQNGKLLGTTPDYLSIRRGKRTTLEFVYGEHQRKEVQLKTKYRWGDSFASNLLFLSLAPIGWLVDYFNGSAFEAEAPSVMRFQKDPKVAEHIRNRLAVAPAVAEDPEIGVLAGEQVHKKMSEGQRYELIPYDPAAFQYYGSEHGLSPKKHLQANLFAELQTDYVLWPQVSKGKNQFDIRGEIKSAYDGKVAESVDFTLAATDAELRSELFSRSRFKEYFHFIPNTLYVNFSSYLPTFEYLDTTYEGEEIGGESFGDKALQYISALSLDREERPRFNVRGQWVYDFVPSLTLSRKRIQFETFFPLQGAEFERRYASAGYSLEFGYQWKYGFPYFNIGPTLTWSQLLYSTPTGEGSEASSVNVMSRVELGYSYFFSDHFIIKVYVKGFSEDKEIWDEALSRASGQTLIAQNVNSNVSGIAIGYYFPSSTRNRSEWKINQKRPASRR